MKWNVSVGGGMIWFIYRNCPLNSCLDLIQAGIQLHTHVWFHDPKFNLTELNANLETVVQPKSMDYLSSHFESWELEQALDYL